MCVCVFSFIIRDYSFIISFFGIQDMQQLHTFHPAVPHLRCSANVIIFTENDKFHSNLRCVSVIFSVRKTARLAVQFSYCNWQTTTGTVMGKSSSNNPRPDDYQGESYWICGRHAECSERRFRHKSYPITISLLLQYYRTLIPPTK